MTGGRHGREKLESKIYTSCRVDLRGTQARVALGQKNLGINEHFLFSFNIFKEGSWRQFKGVENKRFQCKVMTVNHKIKASENLCFKGRVTVTEKCTTSKTDISDSSQNLSWGEIYTTIQAQNEPLFFVFCFFDKMRLHFSKWDYMCHDLHSCWLLHDTHDSKNHSLRIETRHWSQWSKYPLCLLFTVSKQILLDCRYQCVILSLPLYKIMK